MANAYRLTVKQTNIVYFVVEAESEEEARKAFDLGEIDRAIAYAGECDNDPDETITDIEEEA